jgi:hypothetical protein
MAKTKLIRTCVISRPVVAAAFALLCVQLQRPATAIELDAAAPTVERKAPILGLTGKATIDRVFPAPAEITSGKAAGRTPDIDLQRMAMWAMHYLISTPRKDLDYEPVFQCHPLKCPPVPSGRDVVVSCDTDARLNWEWYYMREVSGSQAGQEVENAFHKRLLKFVQDDGAVLCHPGCFNESDIHKVYETKDFVVHIWGATKILNALAEDYRRTKSEKSLEIGRKIVKHLKSLAIYPQADRCYLPCGMAAMRRDGSIVENFWNRHPAPLVGPLVNFYLASGDSDALEFAKAYAEGIVTGAQPDGIRFGADGSFAKPKLGHSHATMHALWGVAELGLVTGEKKYIDFAKRSWDWMLTRGTGTGWFPAMPDSCNETCCLSDMMSIAAIVGRSGNPEYYDYVERYLRNYISNLQFIVTPEFEAYYRKLHKDLAEEKVEQGLKELRKFQGGIIGGSGLNDFENVLHGGISGFEMYGCCVPEGMRAIYTCWKNTIERRDASSHFGPEGVYVNLNLNRTSPWGSVESFLPDEGRLTVKAAVKDTFFLRPPHWVERGDVAAYLGAKKIPVKWSGAYVQFDAEPNDELTITYPIVEFTHHVSGLWREQADLAMTFKWRGNMVVDVDPTPRLTRLFSATPRTLPVPPDDKTLDAKDR